RPIARSSLGQAAKRTKLLFATLFHQFPRAGRGSGGSHSMNATGSNSRGGCHCGRIAFEVEGSPERVSECNCSICRKKGYLHWIVPRESFRLPTPMENVSTYTFNTGIAKHHFCPICGVAAFYI